MPAWEVRGIWWSDQVAVAALLVAAAIAQHAPDYGDAHLMISSVLCLQVGLILLALNLFKMGGLVNLLSHPVITGFVNACCTTHHCLAVARHHWHQHRPNQQPAATGVGLATEHGWTQWL
jgi:hypothetical protein